MNDMKWLEQLKPISDEMLGGLHAGNALKSRIRETIRTQSAAPVPHRKPVLVPALSLCAALAVACAVFVSIKKPEPVQIDTIVAGGEPHNVSSPSDVPEPSALGGARLVAGLGDNASLRMARSAQPSLFAAGDGDMPLVAVGSAVYRLLNAPQNVDDALLSAPIGQIATVTAEPSLASEEEMEAGLSNVAEGTVYSLAGIDTAGAVAARVDGQMRLFQRVSYAGRGPGAQRLEHIFAFRGKAASLDLTDVGTLTGDAANAALDALLDHAVLVSQDASSENRFLTVTLTNGLSFQMGVSGNTLYGCGAWSCPEFFDAFEAAL